MRTSGRFGRVTTKQPDWSANDSGGEVLFAFGFFHRISAVGPVGFDLPKTKKLFVERFNTGDVN